MRADKSPLTNSRKENLIFSFGGLHSRVWTLFNNVFPFFNRKKKLVNIYGRDIFYNITKLFKCGFSFGLSFCDGLKEISIHCSKNDISSVDEKAVADRVVFFFF